MDLFPDGQHVRLQSSDRRGMYLHADEDGRGVRLSRKRASLHAAWQVHRVVRDGVAYVLLHGAAYGRYLALSPEPAPCGHIGRRVVQGCYDGENVDAVTWIPIRVRAGGGEVLLQHMSSHNLLRANGKYCRWHTGVTVDDYFNRGPMMKWVVEAIPPRPFPRELPAPRPDEHPAEGLWNNCIRSVIHGAQGQTIMIRFVRAAYDGSFDPNDWSEFVFQGRSVFNLRSAVATELGEGNALGIKLCARAGDMARLTPLVIDLPRNGMTMDVVVLSTFTPFAAALLEPDVDA